eukprot:131482-Pleurochrysis_carterae.AAC.2
MLLKAEKPSHISVISRSCVANSFSNCFRCSVCPSSSLPASFSLRSASRAAMRSSIRARASSFAMLLLKPRKPCQRDQPSQVAQQQLTGGAGRGRMATQPQGARPKVRVLAHARCSTTRAVY